MMIYDINGASFSDVTGHNAPTTSPNKTEGLSVDQVVAALIGYGVPAAKLQIGVPFYGRGFGGVKETDPTKVIGSDFGGLTSQGTFENSVYSGFDLNVNYIGKNGWESYFDSDYKANYLFNQQRKELISYETP